MTSLATNSRNDIYIGENGDLAIVRDLAAVIQDCEHAMKAQLGEMVLALSQGIPTDETLWSDWNPVQFSAYARTALLAVPNVRSVPAINVTREGNIATYVAEIETVFGITTVAGIIGNG